MTTPAARLRGLLDDTPPVVAPGAFNALFARLIEEQGFPAVYLSGAGVANSVLGRPDLGMVTQTEMVSVAEHVCAAVDVPVICDGDTGYGGVHNVARTVRLYERAGVAAIQLEDQAFPKKCGHFEGKTVVDSEEMVQRIVAALDARSGDDGLLIIARTDARAPLGFDEALDRAHRYAEAGADIIFFEAPQDESELERIGRELAGNRLMANMVEFGKTPLLPAQRLGELGFHLVIYPGALTRTLVPVARRLLADLRDQGSTLSWLDRMATFHEVNEVVGLAEANQWEADIARRAADHRDQGESP
ncbi:MAG: isocitrate lyase/PEP mutase family protein [Acidimicrobiia bacterium]|nr:isocitrate lyase/PEP mutase family protein [Acidimicrobiia bacterium]